MTDKDSKVLARVLFYGPIVGGIILLGLLVWGLMY